MYDEKQLKKDLNLILFVFGKSAPMGFYTAHRYDDNNIAIRNYVDYYILPNDDVILSVESKKVKLTEVDIQSDLGQHILKLAMCAEDSIDRFYKIVRNGEVTEYFWA
jgi:hypothetical protein